MKNKTTSLKDRTLKLFLDTIQSDPNAICAITQPNQTPESAIIQVLDSILKITP